jgi:hypothetical protein
MTVEPTSLVARLARLCAGLRDLALRCAWTFAIVGSAALFVAQGASAQPQRTTSPSSTPAAKVYNVTVTAQTKTTWVDGGCDPYCVRYNGTVKRTESYRGLRITSSEFNGILQLQGHMTGTFATEWDHTSDPPPCHEAPTQRGKANVNVYGRYGVKGNRLPPLMGMGVGPAGPPQGAPVTCPIQTNPIPVVGRVGTSLVGGTLTESQVTLNGFKIGRRANGAPGAPLDQISRGVGFTITLSGSTKDLATTKQELALKKQVTYTEGSVRIVFTPVARKAQSAARAKRSTAARRAAGTTCPKTYPGWWSTKKRACFVVTANARWQLKKTWAQDRNGADCVGAETTRMWWKSKPAVFWVGDTFPAGYSGTSEARTADFLQGPLTATVTVEASGGAYDFGCTPLLTKDCGTRTVTFSEVVPSYTVMVQRPVTLLLTVVATSDAPSPYGACGLVETVDLAPSPDFGGWVIEQKTWSPGISGVLDDLAERRLLATPLGGRVSFRASGQPVDDATYQEVSGYLVGTVTFTRVR